MALYLVVKFLHVLIAIVLVGGGTRAGFAQRLAARNPAPLAFAHRSVGGASSLLIIVVIGPMLTKPL